VYLNYRSIAVEVAGVERMPDLANHGAAAGLDDLAEIIGHLMTKSVVGNQQEPRIRRPSA
jgi:hypothetical protein